MDAVSPVSSLRLALPDVAPDVAPVGALPDVADTDGISSVVCRYAALSVVPPGGRQAHSDDAGDDWLAPCYAVTARVARITTRGALLALGPCAEAEAIAVVQSLLRRFAHLGVRAVVGIGPSCCLAQLVALSLPPEPRHATTAGYGVVSPAAAAALLYRTPVTLLSHLHPAGSVTAKDVARLHRFGLRTCGSVARLGELALRRQFGDATGRFLFAVCRGVDPLPLVPTPQPARLSYRLRLADPLTTDEALAALPDVARRIASDLERRRRRARALALTLTWESGARRTVRTHLRERLGDPRPLAVELARLFGRCCPNPSTSDGRPRAAPLVALRVTLGDLAVAAPAQATFWDTPARRRATVLTVADALDHRYHRPVLLTARLIAPDAIFTEDRYALVPLAGAPDVAPSPTPPTPPLTEDPWRDVAHRLHWW